MKFIDYIPTEGQYQYRRMIERRERQRVLAKLAKALLSVVMLVALYALLSYQDPWLR